MISTYKLELYFTHFIILWQCKKKVNEINNRISYKVSIIIHEKEKNSSF